MPRGIKVANPGINALTNTNPKNFSLYVDGTTNHILIKEFTHNTVSVPATTTTEITHNLGYLPFVMVMVQLGSYYYWVYGLSAYNDYNAYVDTTKLYLRNSSGGARNYTYYIFYDEL